MLKDMKLLTMAILALSVMVAANSQNKNSLFWNNYRLLYAIY